jgi:predicted nucleic acid-binding protein
MVVNALRILDADILAYALYDESPAHDQAWEIVKQALSGDLDLSITHTTLLETYNTLFWFYHVRPLSTLLEKLILTVDGLTVIDTAISGLRISQTENISLGDGFLIGTALNSNKPIIVSNDSHLLKVAPKYGLIVENPISSDIKKALSKWKPENTN